MKTSTGDDRLLGWELVSSFKLCLEHPDVILAPCPVSDSGVLFKFQGSESFYVFADWYSEELQQECTSICSIVSCVLEVVHY